MAAGLPHDDPKRLIQYYILDLHWLHLLASQYLDSPFILKLDSRLINLELDDFEYVAEFEEGIVGQVLAHQFGDFVRLLPLDLGHFELVILLQASPIVRDISDDLNHVIDVVVFF